MFVFRGPVNEDVFAAQPFHGGKIMDSDIQEISEQIHRLLLQVKKRTLDQSTQASCKSVSVCVISLFLSSADP